MEIIKIGNDSMKISLCNNEAYEYGIAPYQREEDAQRGFARLLVKTKEKLNFKPKEEKIVGEIFCGRDGGCEIFVSRVEAQDKVYKEKIPQDVVKKPRPLTSVYSFDDIEKLLIVVRRLNDIKYGGESSVYYNEQKGKYYIILEDVSIKELKYAFLAEYAKSLKSNLSYYIKEHYTSICKKDGIKILSKC